jgi:hypothetical protein
MRRARRAAAFIWSWRALLALAWFAYPTRAEAAEGDLPTVVLGLEAQGGTPESVATEVTDALRQRVAATKGHQLLQGKDLVEVKLVFGCPDEAPACMAQAGKSLGAAKLIFGSVRQVGTDYQINLKLMDVSRAAIDSVATDTIAKKQSDASSLRSLAPRWMAKLSGKGGGVIHVRANLEGAAVTLDGTRVGVIGADPIILNDVAPGRHEVAVEKEGYTTTKQEFTLAAGQSLPLSFTLSPVSVEVPRPDPLLPLGQGAPAPADDGGSPSLTRVGFWIAVAGTLASAGLALKFGLDVDDINGKLDRYRNQSLSAQEMADVKDLTNDGSRAEVMQWVCIGLTGAFATASAVLLYKGFLSSEGTRSASNHGLRLFPTATASAGGIIAEFEF